MNNKAHNYIDNVLISLKRQYSKDELVSTLVNQLKLLKDANDILKSDNEILSKENILYKETFGTDYVFDPDSNKRNEKKLDRCVQRYEIITKIKRNNVLDNKYMKKKHNISFI